MQIQKIYIGGWFQRTTLHLTEIFDFLNEGRSGLGFPQKSFDEARAELALSIADRPVGVAREITKQFETIYRGTAEECLIKLRSDKILGEFVIVARAQ